MQRSDLSPCTATPTYKRRSLLAGLAISGVAALGAPVSALRPTASAQAYGDAAPFAVRSSVLELTYIGPTSDPDTLVVIVLPNEQADQAFASLYRGSELSIRFTGHINDDVLSLASGSPPQDTPHFVPVPTMSGALGSDGITGEVRLRDQVLTFTAVPVTASAVSPVQGRALRSRAKHRR